MRLFAEVFMGSSTRAASLRALHRPSASELLGRLVIEHPGELSDALFFIKLLVGSAAHLFAELFMGSSLRAASSNS